VRLLSKRPATDGSISAYPCVLQKNQMQETEEQLAAVEADLQQEKAQQVGPVP
jgi:hypothetical protein